MFFDPAVDLLVLLQYRGGITRYVSRYHRGCSPLYVYTLSRTKKKTDPGAKEFQRRKG